MSESKIKRGIPEIEECTIKKKKIKNTGSDVEVSSDDDGLQIVESSYSNSSISIESPQERKSDVSNLKFQSRELSCRQIPSASVQQPVITTSSSLLNLNNKSCSTYDFSKYPLNVDSKHLVINNVVPSHRDPRIIHTNNNGRTHSIYNKYYQKDDLYVIPGYVNQSPDDKSETVDSDLEEIFRKLTEILEAPSEYKNNVTKSQNELFLNQNQNLKQSLVEPSLSVSHNTEASSKNSMNVLFDDYGGRITPNNVIYGCEKNVTESQNELLFKKNQNILKQTLAEPSLSVPHNTEAFSKSNINVLFGDCGSSITSNDVKNTALGVQLSMSSNFENTLKINKTSNELMETIKSKAEEKARKKMKISNIVIKLLSPYYCNEMFKTKELFKFMAREMVHKLLESVINPEENVIELLIKNMFPLRNNTKVESEDQIMKLLESIP